MKHAQCTRSEEITRNVFSCKYAKPSTDSWDLVCTNPCVIKTKEMLADLERRMSNTIENNKKLVDAFEKFLPMCRDVVEASEAVKKQTEEAS